MVRQNPCPATRHVSSSWIFEEKKKLTATSLLAQLNSDNAFGGGDEAAVLVAAPGEDMVGSKSKGAGEDDAGEIEVILLGESSLAK